MVSATLLRRGQQLRLELQLEAVDLLEDGAALVGLLEEALACGRRGR
jgi:hypothetical protein